MAREASCHCDSPVSQVNRACPFSSSKKKTSLFIINPLRRGTASFQEKKIDIEESFPFLALKTLAPLEQCFDYIMCCVPFKKRGFPQELCGSNKPYNHIKTEECIFLDFLRLYFFKC